MKKAREGPLALLDLYQKLFFAGDISVENSLVCRDEDTHTKSHTLWGLLYVCEVYGKRSMRQNASLRRGHDAPHFELGSYIVAAERDRQLGRSG